MIHTKNVKKKTRKIPSLMMNVFFPKHFRPLNDTFFFGGGSRGGLKLIENKLKIEEGLISL